MGGVWSEIVKPDVAKEVAPLLIATAIFGPHPPGLAGLLMDSVWSGGGTFPGSRERGRDVVSWLGGLEPDSFILSDLETLVRKIWLEELGLGRSELQVPGALAEAVREFMRERLIGLVGAEVRREMEELRGLPDEERRRREEDVRRMAVEELQSVYVEFLRGVGFDKRFAEAVGGHFDAVAEVVGSWIVGLGNWRGEWGAVERFFGRVSSAAVMYAVLLKIGELVEPRASERLVKLWRELGGKPGGERAVARAVGYLATSAVDRLGGGALTAALHFLGAAVEVSSTGEFHLVGLRIYKLVGKELFGRVLDLLAGGAEVERDALGSALSIATRLIEAGWGMDIAEELGPLIFAVADRIGGDIELNALAIRALSVLALRHPGGGKRALDKARVLADRLAGRHLEARVALALSLPDLAKALLAAGELSDVGRYLTKAEEYLNDGEVVNKLREGGVDVEGLRRGVAGLIAGSAESLLGLGRLAEAEELFIKARDASMRAYERDRDPSRLRSALASERRALSAGFIRAFLSGDEGAIERYLHGLVKLGVEYERRCAGVARRLFTIDRWCRDGYPVNALNHAAAVAASALLKMLGVGEQLKPLWSLYAKADPEHELALAALLHALGMVSNGSIEGHKAVERLELYGGVGRLIRELQATTFISKEALLAVCLYTANGDLGKAKELASLVANNVKRPLDRELFAKLANAVGNFERDRSGRRVEQLALGLLAIWLYWYGDQDMIFLPS